MSAAFDWARSGPARQLLALLNDAGEARPVGGCVRESLLGRPPGTAGATDIDIATTLEPSRVIALCDLAGLRVIPTGLAHGTVTVMIDRMPFEVTTLRADLATDGRHATVAFGTDWAVDAARRDFTINAIYLCPDGTLYDPQGGVADLASRKVKFIGSAARRIEEDYLRILRFLRFSARFADDLDEAGWLACVEAREGLHRLSKERVWAELSRLFRAPRSPMALRAAALDGVLTVLCPAAPDADAFAVVHRLAGGEPSPALAFAALWPDADETLLLASFRPSRAERTAILGARAVAAALRAGTSPRAVLYVHGETAYREGLWLARAQGLPSADEMAPERLSRPINPARAGQFLARGVPAGVAVGEALARFEAAWIKADFPQDEADVVRLIDAAAAPPAD